MVTEQELRTHLPRVFNGGQRTIQGHDSSIYLGLRVADLQADLVAGERESCRRNVLDRIQDILYQHAHRATTGMPPIACTANRWSSMFTFWMVAVATAPTSWRPCQTGLAVSRQSTAYRTPSFACQRTVVW